MSRCAVLLAFTALGACDSGERDTWAGKNLSAQLRDKINEILEKSLTDGKWDDIYKNTLGKSGAEGKHPTLEKY